MSYPYTLIGISTLLILGPFLQTKVRALSDGEIEQELLEKIFQNYTNTVRASDNARNTDSNATFVTINLYIRSIDYIDDVKMEYGVQLTFRQEWQDDRLKYSHYPEYSRLPYLTLKESKQIWKPDIFFSNEKGGHIHGLITPNVYVRIFPDGHVRYSLRITLKLSCPMIMKLYPMDKQTCSLRMASYAYTTKNIIFQWKNDDGVQVTPELHLPRFELEQFTTDYCDSHTNTGIYSCLRVDFLFKRKISYYMKQIYIPCTVAVLIAWLSFWLEAKQIGRGLLVLATWLIMIFCMILLNYTLPPVSYTMAIDVWNVVCLVFVLFALCQFVVVHYLSKGTSNRKSVIGGGGEGITFWQSFKRMSLSQKFDVVTRILYPALFILFQIIYWTAYNLKKDTFNPEQPNNTSPLQPGKRTWRQPSGY